MSKKEFVKLFDAIFIIVGCCISLVIFKYIMIMMWKLTNLVQDNLWLFLLFSFIYLCFTISRFNKQLKQIQ